MALRTFARSITERSWIPWGFSINNKYIFIIKRWHFPVQTTPKWMYYDTFSSTNHQILLECFIKSDSFHVAAPLKMMHYKKLLWIRDRALNQKPLQAFLHKQKKTKKCLFTNSTLSLTLSTSTSLSLFKSPYYTISLPFDATLIWIPLNFEFSEEHFWLTFQISRNISLIFVALTVHHLVM